MGLTFHEGSFWLTGHNETRIKPISISKAVRLKASADKLARKVINRILVKFYDAPAGPLPSFLDDHQKEGVNWILTRSRCYLAHAPGAGKTCQAIMAHLLSPQPGLQSVFIVPPSLVENWVREILKWTKAYREEGFSQQKFDVSHIGTSARRHEVNWSADFLVVPDSMLTKPWVYNALLKIKILILAVDEASRFKEPSAERTVALFGGQGKHSYKGLTHKASHTVLLDGSPMPNRPRELWAPVIGTAPEVIDFIDMNEFGVKYCAGYMITNKFGSTWDFTGASNQDELRERLTKSFMHVVTEEELDHPERRRSMTFMNDPRPKKMREWEQKNLSNVDLSNISEDMSEGSIASYRRELGLTKIDWVVKYVRERLEKSKDEAIIVFAWHREVCERIAQALSDENAGLVIGGTSSEARENYFEAFKNGSRRVLVGNIGAMGRGHNLQVASRVVFAEFSWTDELNKQCEKRASRKGSLRSFVRCDYIVVPDSLDEIILNAVFTKAKNVKRVIG